MLEKKAFKPLKLFNILLNWKKNVIKSMSRLKTDKKDYGKYKKINV